jgi:hypothetical protein
MILLRVEQTVMEKANTVFRNVFHLNRMMTKMMTMKEKYFKKILFPILRSLRNKIVARIITQKIPVVQIVLESLAMV